MKEPRIREVLSENNITRNSLQSFEKNLYALMKEQVLLGGNRHHLIHWEDHNHHRKFQDHYHHPQLLQEPELLQKTLEQFLLLINCVQQHPLYQDHLLLVLDPWRLHFFRMSKQLIFLLITLSWTTKSDFYNNKKRTFILLCYKLV